MPVPWQSSIEILARILHHHGVDPDAVADVHATWAAFEEFLQTQLDGLADGEDADGFIVQWGRWSWNDSPSESVVHSAAGYPGRRGPQLAAQLLAG